MAPEQIHTKFARLLNQQYLQISVAVLPTTASWGNFTGFFKPRWDFIYRTLSKSTCLSTQGSGLLLHGAFAANEDKMTRTSRIPSSIVPLARHLAKECSPDIFTL